jgi:hypothetical protein
MRACIVDGGRWQGRRGTGGVVIHDEAREGQGQASVRDASARSLTMDASEPQLGRDQEAEDD